MTQSFVLAIFLALFGSGTARCPACSKSRAELETMRVDAIKVHLLSKLGLSAAPNVSGHKLPKVPPLLTMLQSRELQPALPSSSSEDDYNARTEQMIVFPARDHEFLVGKPRAWWFFDVKRKKSRLKVVRGSLWVHLNKDFDTEKPSSYFNLNIYQGTRPLQVNNVPSKLLVASRQFSGGESGWQSIKLKRVVNAWVQEKQINLGLFVELIGARPGKVIFPGEEPNLQPFLDVHTKDNGNKRRARRLASLECNSADASASRTCCRHPLTIDFHLIGWDFVVAPRTYEAAYCTGDCANAGHGLRTYYHLHFAQKEQKRLGQESNFCCSPKKVSPISMLYVLDGNIIYEKVPGMRVEACGCS